MTTETTPATAGPVATPASELRVIPIAQLRESATNPRTTFDTDDLEASIRAQGVLVPIIVRPVAHDSTPPFGSSGTVYEIIDGARRARAAAGAGLVEIPALVRTLEDLDVRVTQLVTTLQRADLAPLEEARAFRALLDFTSGTHSPRSLADSLGKTERDVWNSLKLLDLVPDAQHLLETRRITLAHAIPLARLTAAQQEKAIDPDAVALFEHETDLLSLRDAEDDELDDDPARDRWAGLKAVSPREFESWISQKVRFNAQAMAQAAPLDFGSVAAEIDFAAAQPGRGRKVVQITHDYHVQPDARADGERTYCHNSWKRADGRNEESPTCDRSVLGVVVVGPEYGATFAVCINKECDVHWGEEKSAPVDRSRTGSNASSSTGRDQEERERQQKLQAKENERRAGWKKKVPAIEEAVAHAIARMKPAALAAVLYHALEDPYGRKRMPRVEELLGSAKTGDDIVRSLACLEALKELDDDYAAPREFPQRAKKLFNCDLTAILAGDQAAKPGATNQPARSKTKKGAATPTPKKPAKKRGRA